MADEYFKSFKVFSEVSKAIHAGANTKEILECIVARICEITSAKGCIFWIVNEGVGEIETMISHGFPYKSLASVDYNTLLKIFDFKDTREVFIENARYDQRIPELERLGKKRVGSVTGSFYEITNSYVGILAVYFTNFKKLTQIENELVTALGEQGAIALQRSISYDDEMMKLLRQMVEGFTLALEAKDEKTHGHSLRVAQFSKLTAKELGFTVKEIEQVYHAALLHDIGKIGIQDYVLDSLGRLSSKDMNKVKTHPVIGAKIIRPLAFLNDLEPLILNHHERFDGSGYPKGKKGEKIPLGARIIGVCDAFETMLAGRNHMPRLPLSDAIKNLQNQANLHFDPKVINALFSVIEKNPEIIDSKGSVEKCLEQLRKNIDRIGLDNILKKKIELSPFSF